MPRQDSEYLEIVTANNQVASAEARIAELEAQNKRLVEALENMTIEFKYDDHNLTFLKCNCISHQNYHAACKLLAELSK